MNALAVLALTMALCAEQVGGLRAAVVVAAEPEAEATVVPRFNSAALAVLVGVRDYEAFPVNAFALLDLYRFGTYLREEVGLPGEREIRLEDPTDGDLRRLFDGERGVLWSRIQEERPAALILYLHVRCAGTAQGTASRILGRDARPERLASCVSLEHIRRRCDALGVPSVVLLDGGLALETLGGGAGVGIGGELPPRQATQDLERPTAQEMAATGMTIIRGYGDAGLAYWDSFRQSGYFTSRLLTNLRRAEGGVTGRRLMEELNQVMRPETEARFGAPQELSGAGALDAVLVSGQTHRRGAGLPGGDPSPGAASQEVGDALLGLEVGLAPVVTLASGGTRGHRPDPTTLTRLFAAADLQAVLAGLMPSLHTGDLITMTFFSSEPAYLYVANVDAVGNYAKVVPHPLVPEFTNPFQGTLRYPPGEGHFLEVSGVRGVEFVVSFLSGTPRPGLLNDLGTFLTRHAPPSPESWSTKSLEAAIEAFCQEQLGGQSISQTHRHGLRQSVAQTPAGPSEVVSIARQAVGRDFVWVVDAFWNGGRSPVGSAFRER